MKEKTEHILLKLICDNGDYEFTRFNGSLEEAQKYYIGCWFTYWDAIECKEKRRTVTTIEQVEIRRGEYETV